MLQVLAYAPDRQYDKRALRILDFYAVFPHLIPDIRLPREEMKWRKRFAGLGNPYWFSGEPKLVFAQMEPLQETAQNLLYAQGLADPVLYPDQVKLVIEGFRRLALPASTSMSSTLVEFLVTVLGKIPFLGYRGLKDRTGLLEHRYDAV
jgi:hypothetical protein